MILVVTPNPAVDVTYRVAGQRVGTTQRVLDVARRPGGKGLNVGRVLDAVGIPSRAVLPLGGPAGRWIADGLDALGLAHVDVPVTGETRTTVTVVDDVEHPTMFGEPGPAVTADEWAAVTDVIGQQLDGGAGFLVVSGSLPHGTDPGVVADWVTAARARGVPSLVDCAGGALLAAADAGATICKPNRDELLEATGAVDERSGALDLLDRGAGVVVVSRGADGLAAHTHADVVEVRAVPGVSGNPTGAGDAATAGLLAALLRASTNGPTNPTTTATAPSASAPSAPRVDRAALRSAAAFGAAAVLRPVAGEVDLDALQGFLADGISTPSGAHPSDPTWSPA